MRKNAAAAAEPTEATAAVAAPMYHPALELSAIVESPLNPRKRYDEKALEDMAATMRASGVLTPVLVRHTDDAGKFELAAGHRRCRAARLAGLLTVPATIRHLNDREFLEILHLENLQREDVDPLDEALGYEQLMTQGYDVSSLAEKIGKSITYVASRMRLLTLCAAARAAMQLGYLPLSHAIELAKLTEARQRETLDELFCLSVEKLDVHITGEPLPSEEDSEESGDEDSLDEDDDSRSSRFQVARRSDPFARDEWDPPVIPTIDELRRDIKRSLRRLKVVPWDLADATLLPDAGACTSCPKRSGMAPALFVEMDRGEDACLDEDCYDAKHAALHARKTGDAPPVEQVAKPARVTSDWEVQRKGQEAAARRKQERLQRGRDAAVGALVAEVGDFHFLDSGFLRQFFAALLQEVHGDVHARLLKFLGLPNTPPEKNSGFSWRVDRLKAWALDGETTDERIPPAVMFAVLGDETGISQYGAPRSERLDAFAELLKVPVKTIAAAAEKEKPAKPAKQTKNKKGAKAA